MEIAAARGLVAEYGIDTVQAYIAAGFGAVEIAVNQKTDGCVDETIGEEGVEQNARNNNLDARTIETDERANAASRIITAKELRTMTFRPLRFLLPGLIPEGFTIFASRPKLGKSWFVLDLGLASAADRYTLGNLKPAQGDVLYLALEDSPRRLQRRIDKLLSTFGQEWPERMELVTEWPRLHEGGLAKLDQWCVLHPARSLIVIDTLEMVRQPDGISKNRRAYALDYEATVPLRRLSSERSVAIIGVTHDRKAEADDVFDTLQGTLGASGGADTLMVLKRHGGAVTLHVRGRDVEETQSAVQFEKASCKWTILGAAAEVHRSAERGRVVAALREAGKPMNPDAIRGAAELKSRNATDILLGRMVRDGEIIRTDRGYYDLPDGHVGQNGQNGQKERSTH